MNILGGVYTRDSGSVVFEGQKLEHSSVASAEQAGIAFVHQELNLFNDLTVYENIFLRKELTNKLGTLDKKAMIQQSAALFEHLGVDIDPRAMVSELETGKKQLLEIAKSSPRQGPAVYSGRAYHRLEQRGDRPSLHHCAQAEGAGQFLYLYLT